MVDSKSRPPAKAEEKKKPKEKIQSGDKLAFTIDEAVQSSTIGETSLCKEIKAKRLIVHKYGTRSVILRSNLLAFLENLPVGHGSRHGAGMRRREFISLLGGAAAAWPFPARPQNSSRARLVAVLMNNAENDEETKAQLGAFLQELRRLGWVEDRNLRVVVRYAADRPDQYPMLAKELVAAQPDVIFAYTTPIVTALRLESRIIPIVFAQVSDPVGSGLVASLARPGGNVTGLLLYEEGIAGKWVSMLKEIAPNIKRAALLANPKTTPYEYFARSAETVAGPLAIELVPSLVESSADIERVIATFAGPDTGVLVLPSGTTTLYRNLVIALADRHRLPSVYPFRFYVTAGGLMAYSTDLVGQSRQAASYVDRILRGTSPAELPVQAPTKYITTVNLKTAKALGLVVPPSLLVRADELIE